MALAASRTIRGLLRGPLWILEPRLDLALVVATPLFVLPAVLALREGLSAGQIGVYVAAFGALGHHLPGMMRAYGDPELFARFRARFLAAPVFLLGVCWLFNAIDFAGIELIVLLWGLWHGLSQVYGFGRIYDGKARSREPRTAHLDLAICIAWFGSGFLHSQNRVVLALTTFYEAGGPLIPAPAFRAFLVAWFAGTAMVTALFLCHLVWRWTRGKPQSPVKLLLMASAFGFWWYAMNGSHPVILGVAMFEIFHDIQYLTIVWVFNRKRVDEGAGLSSFMRFTFRKSGLLIGVYVGSVVAYGSIGLLPEVVASQSARDFLLSVVAASTLLHFYFDGFIWKVREASTAKRLGLESDGAGAQRAGGAGWMRHAAAWSLLAIPLGLAGLAQARGVGGELPRLQNIATIAPDLAAAQYNLAVARGKRGEARRAIESYERALAADPGHARARINLGLTRKQIGDSRGAVRELERAVAGGTEIVDAQNSLAWVLATDPDPEVRDPDAAVALAEAASAARAGDARVSDTLAAAYAAAGRFDEATAVAERALAEARSLDDAALATEIAEHLALYRSRRPYRE